MSEYRDKWIKIGLSTEPACREQAEAGIKEMYRSARLAQPRKIVWCGSPLSQGITRVVILDKRVGASVGDSVGASVWASGYGQHDANWLAYYEYFREVCGLDSKTNNLTGHIMQAKLWTCIMMAGGLDD
jgi:hypothetical protein